MYKIESFSRRLQLLAPFAALVMLAAAGHAESDHFKNSDAPRLNFPSRPLTPEMKKIQQENLAEHAREMALLHLKALRPGHDGRNPDAPNAANYDPALANPYPYKPDVLRLTGGKDVTTPEQWWKERRPQIVAAFDEYIYGRVPAHTPSVSWSVTGTKSKIVGKYKAITKRLVGHVDNSADPAIKVDIQAAETLPAGVTGKVPVIVEFSWLKRPAFMKGFKMPPGPPGPDWREQILAHGWGYVVLDPTSVQADNAAGLTQGIIGLVNKGRPRKMDDWGALRAWQWGASRLLDYLRTDPHVAGDEVGIAGHSRYGKAAIVTLAFDPRFAIGYISSSGEGGAKLWERNYGETVEDVAGPSEFHWMAGNFLRYAADPLTAKDMPVDADALIALCAPRPIFISGGSTAAGDAWVDAQGMFMAATGAGPVYRLLGKKDLGTDTFPPMETALISGDIGFRQHQYGHTQAPNWPTFLMFARKYLHVRQD